MNNKTITPIDQTSAFEPVSLLHNTNSNSKGYVATYYAIPSMTSKVNVPINIIYIPAYIMGFIYSAAWISGLNIGVVK